MNCRRKIRQRVALSVRFLVSCASAWTAELLWLASSWIDYDECSIVLCQDALYLLL